MNKKNENQWLLQYKRNIDNLVYQLQDYHLRGSYGGNIDLLAVIRLFKGAVIEIERLQEEVIKLKKDLKESKTKQPPQIPVFMQTEEVK